MLLTAGAPCVTYGGMSSESTTYRNQAARNVLAILDEFGRKQHPLTASELGASLSMTKNMIQRALALLEEEGFVIRERKGHRYRLGPDVLGLSGAIEEDDEDIVAICHPAMEAMSRLTGESVFLGIIVGRNRVVIDLIEGSGRRVAHSQRGLAVPLHVSKASRVLLSALSDSDIERYLKEGPPLSDFVELFAASANETEKDVWDDVHAVRRDGYIAWSNPEQYGGSYIAFPVLDGEGRPHAVISIGAPTERFPVSRFLEMLPRFRAILVELQLRARLLPAPVIVMGQAA